MVASITDRFRNLRYGAFIEVPHNEIRNYTNILNLFMDKNPWFKAQITMDDEQNNYKITRMPNNKETAPMDTQLRSIKRPADARVVGEGRHSRWRELFESMEPESDLCLSVDKDQIKTAESAMAAFKRKHDYKPRFAVAPFGEGGKTYWRLTDGPPKTPKKRGPRAPK